MEAALLAATGKEVLVAAKCWIHAGKDRLQRDDTARAVHHRYQQGAVDVAEDKAIAVAHRPWRHTQAMCMDALAYEIGVVGIGRNGSVPQHVGRPGGGVLAFALMPFALAAGRLLALPDGTLLGGAQRGRRFRAPGMAGAGPPAAELAGRHVVSKQHRPTIARATTVAFHMEAHQRAIGVERVAAARVRHDAVRVHGLQERGNDVLRGMRCVHSTRPLGTWIGPRRPMAANVLCSVRRAQVTQRPTDAVWSGCDGSGDTVMVSERGFICNTFQHLTSLIAMGPPSKHWICDGVRRSL